MSLIDKENSRQKTADLPILLGDNRTAFFLTQKDCEPVYRYMFCPECNALLAIFSIVQAGGMNNGMAITQEQLDLILK